MKLMLTLFDMILLRVIRLLCVYDLNSLEKTNSCINWLRLLYQTVRRGLSRKLGHLVALEVKWGAFFNLNTHL